MSDEPRKGFIVSNEAWYCQKPETRLPEDEIIIGQYFDDSSCEAEFTVKWKDIGTEIVPRLEVYHDAWYMMQQMPELINELGNLDNKDIVPNDLSNTLLELGYEDLTERTQNIKL